MFAPIVNTVIRGYPQHLLRGAGRAADNCGQPCGQGETDMDDMEMFGEVLAILAALQASVTHLESALRMHLAQREPLAPVVQLRALGGSPHPPSTPELLSRVAARPD